MINEALDLMLRADRLEFRISRYRDIQISLSLHTATERLPKNKTHTHTTDVARSSIYKPP